MSNGVLRAQGFTLFRQGLYGAILLLLALVLFGASQGALKISLMLFLMRNTVISGSIFVYHGFAGGAGRCSVGNRRGNYAGAFRNPMADPGLLGVSSGSALRLALLLCCPSPSQWCWCSMSNGVCHCRKFSGLHHHFSHHARHRDGSMMQLLLAGIAINARAAQRSAS